MRTQEKEEEAATEHVVLRPSTKLALETIGKKNDNYDDVLRSLLKGNTLFQKALQSAYLLLAEERKARDKLGKAQQAPS